MLCTTVLQQQHRTWLQQSDWNAAVVYHVAAVVLLCIYIFGYLVTGPSTGSSVAFGFYLPASHPSKPPHLALQNLYAD